MAISLAEYLQIESEKRDEWMESANVIEKEIDIQLLNAVSENLVPNTKNKNFVLRYMFSEKVVKEVKDILKIRYGNVGWKIIENADFKEAMTHGYFDFYRTK
jgi:hypothetical protein